MDIVHYIEGLIRSGELTIGDRLPSVNALKIRFGYSRSTVFLAMEDLRSRGIIEGEERYGNYVSSNRIEVQEKILLLFNEFNAFKEDLYNSFVEAMGSSASIDIMFHNYNRHVFETLLSNANGKYTTYVVMPGKMEGLGPLFDNLNGRVILADHFAADINGHYPSVGQDFAQDTYDGLCAELQQFKRYHTLVLVQHAEKEPVERYDGILRFCEDYGFQSHYVPSMKDEKIRMGELYLTADDRELVYLLKKAEKQNLDVGKDFGIISYNETPLKEVLSGGITTLSTDFCQMGRTLAQLILSGEDRTVVNPSRLILRKSC